MPSLPRAAALVLALLAGPALAGAEVAPVQFVQAPAHVEGTPVSPPCGGASPLQNSCSVQFSSSGCAPECGIGLSPGPGYTGTLSATVSGVTRTGAAGAHTIACTYVAGGGTQAGPLDFKITCSDSGVGYECPGGGLPCGYDFWPPYTLTGNSRATKDLGPAGTWSVDVETLS